MAQPEYRLVVELVKTWNTGKNGLDAKSGPLGRILSPAVEGCIAILNADTPERQHPNTVVRANNSVEFELTGPLKPSVERGVSIEPNVSSAGIIVDGSDRLQPGEMYVD